MFTVIIPTMWKPITFEELLISLCDCEYIDEIILIDNNIFQTPDFPVLKNKKILKINPPENLIVNPSWNLGVMLSKNNNVCLLNDDLIIDTNVFKFMSYNKEKHLCGISIKDQEGQLRLEEAEKRILAFGCMMFVRKDSYEKIPKDIIMFYGDDYLFHLNKSKGNKNYYIYGCKNNNIWGVTSCNGVLVDEYKKNIIETESVNIQRILNEKGIIFHSE